MQIDNNISLPSMLDSLKPVNENLNTGQSLFDLESVDSVGEVKTQVEPSLHGNAGERETISDDHSSTSALSDTATAEIQDDVRSSSSDPAEALFELDVWDSEPRLLTTPETQDNLDLGLMEIPAERLANFILEGWS